MIKEIHLLPEPASTEWLWGKYLLGYDAYIVLPLKSSERIYRQACFLKEAIRKTLGYDLHLTRGEARPGDIAIRYLENLNNIKSLKNTTYLKNLENSGDESEYYELSLDETGAVITGTERSIIYGMQTFIMLLEQAGAALPGVRIADYPQMAYRGFLFDVTRGRVPTLTMLKWLADQMARYKLNQMQLYVEHTYLFRDFSEVWRDDTPITPEEIMELDAYCLDRGIELVPAVATGGHLYELLRTRQYRHLCELDHPDREKFTARDRQMHHTLDVSNAESLRLVKKMLAEYRPLFSSNRFNICGDETFDLGKGKSKALCEKMGVGQAYVDYVKQVCDDVISLGCTPMMWGDMIAEHPELIGELPPETVFLNWSYHAEVTGELTRKFAEAGVTYYNCPGVNCWNRLIDDYGIACENIRRMTEYAHAGGAVGLLNTAWGDHYHTSHPEFILPGLIYGAQAAWRRPLPKEQLDTALSILEFGPGHSPVMEILSKIEANSIYNFMQLCTFQEYMPERNGPAEVLEAAFAGRERLERVAAAEPELLRVKEELASFLAAVPKAKTQMLNAALLAADGTRYLNRLGAAVAKREYFHEPVGAEEAGELAERLEHWFYYYKKLWREVSKESELIRIQYIIDWYCDYLRDINTK